MPFTYTFHSIAMWKKMIFSAKYTEFFVPKISLDRIFRVCLIFKL